MDQPALSPDCRLLIRLSINKNGVKKAPIALALLLFSAVFFLTASSHGQDAEMIHEFFAALKSDEGVGADEGGGD